MSDKKLYKKVHLLPNLQKSWETVRKNGLASNSKNSNDDIFNYEQGVGKKLLALKKKLKNEEFLFKKSTGVAAKRKNKESRPIVVAPIENRIVQRSILNVLLKEEKIKSLNNQATSFGGIPNRNVADAFKLITEKAKTAKYFARSDIKSFFRNIPQADLIQLIIENLSIKDETFERLFLNAIKTELDNYELLGDEKDLFPLGEIGIAQGSSLSPLLANIFLNEFDQLSNKHGVCCIRFVDDYLLLGPDKKTVELVFNEGKSWLEKKDLSVYDPFEKNEKGKSGPLYKGFDFLGCSFSPGRINPSSKSIENLKLKIQTKLNNSLNDIDKISLAEAIMSVRNTVLGWGNSYQFCNAREKFEGIDQWIEAEIIKFHREYLKKLQAREDISKITRRLGIQPLTTCKSNPLYPYRSINP